MNGGQHEIRWGTDATSEKLAVAPSSGMIRVDTASGETLIVRRHLRSHPPSPPSPLSPGTTAADAPMAEQPLDVPIGCPAYGTIGTPRNAAEPDAGVDVSPGAVPMGSPVTADVQSLASRLAHARLERGANRSNLQ